MSTSDLFPRTLRRVVGDELEVDAAAALRLHARAAQVEVEARKRAREAEGLRLALVFVVGEEVHAVLLDRTAERRADLLVLVRQHAVLHEVLRDELVVAEVAGERARRDVGARLGDRVDQRAARPALGRVEPVRRRTRTPRSRRGCTSGWPKPPVWFCVTRRPSTFS